ncbi:MAG: Histone deacetylase-like amidohydrolase [Pseudomonadota bacterium]
MGATGYFTHSDCRLHEMGEGHPECPQRLDAIEDRLLGACASFFGRH